MVRMKMQITFILILSIHVLSSFSITKHTEDKWKKPYDPDVSHNVSELISSKGYPVEDYIVQTVDGYLLSMQRIPHGKNNSNGANKPAVLLQHGLVSASSDWVLNFPEQSLGFILSDAGYHVWLGNIRGNTYSRRHVKLKPDTDAFWNYSFDEMAEYDLPAMIDYVLNKTGHRQLIYIGHSQGTTAAFALLSENPLYNQKIKLFVALAPVATIGYLTSFLKYFAPFTTELDILAEFLGIRDFLPNNGVIKFLDKELCESEIKFACDDFVFYLFGFDKSDLNETRIPVYFAHTPAGTSVKSVSHYGQMVISKKFQKYDYGKHNKKYYNQTTPPEYDVSKITTPTALIWSTGDNLADIVDVNLLQRKLKSLVQSYCVPKNRFNHIDFIVALDANKLVYQDVLNLLQRFADV